MFQRYRARLAGLLTRFGNSRSGTVYIWVAGGLFAIIGIGGLAVDMGYLYALRNQTQTAADAAALAAVVDLPDDGAAIAAAVQFSEKNLPTAANGTALKAEDVVVGNWNGNSFTAAGAPENAVMVTVRRSKANGNPAAAFLSRIFGIDSLDVSATAVAWHAPDCLSGQGIMARDKVYVEKDVVVQSGSCIYGENGVQFSQNTTLEEGANAGALDASTITYQQGFQGDPDSFYEGEVDFGVVDDVDALIDDIENGVDLPPHITNVEIVDELPSDPTPGTAYVINGNVHLDQSIAASDILIAVRGEIVWGQNGSLTNTHGTCPNGEPGIGIIATQNIRMEQNSNAEGVQLISGDTIHIEQGAVLAGSAIAANDAQVQQAPLISPCDNAVDISAGARSRLVL